MIHRANSLHAQGHHQEAQNLRNHATTLTQQRSVLQAASTLAQHMAAAQQQRPHLPNSTNSSSSPPHPHSSSSSNASTIAQARLQHMAVASDLVTHMLQPSNSHTTPGMAGGGASHGVGGMELLEALMQQHAAEESRGRVMMRPTGASGSAVQLLIAGASNDGWRDGGVGLGGNSATTGR